MTKEKDILLAAFMIDLEFECKNKEATRHDDERPQK
jgi:hypothetical protein